MDDEDSQLLQLAHDQEAMDAAMAVAAAAAVAAQQQQEDQEQHQHGDASAREQYQAPPQAAANDTYGQHQAEQHLVEETDQDEQLQAHIEDSLGTGGPLEGDVQAGAQDVQDEQQRHLAVDDVLDSEQRPSEEAGDYAEASTAMQGDVSEMQYDDESGQQLDVYSDNEQPLGDDDAVASSSRALGSLSNAPSSRSMSHRTKRRKINTCLPCKRRKVKCDREKPYCGQCKKSQIPASDCLWSASVDHHIASAAAHPSAPSTTFTAVEAPSVESTNIASGGQWDDSNAAPWPNYGSGPSQPAAEDNTQMLLERIVALEAALSAAQQRSYGGAGRDLNGSNDVERGLAADALAMIAQQTPSAANAYAEAERIQAKLKFRRLLASNEDAASNVLAWPASTGIAEKTKDAISILPESKTITALLQHLDAIQAHGMHFGISTRLLETQLDPFLAHVARAQEQNQRIHPVDLSFLAALLYFLAAAADLLSYEQALALEIAVDEYGVTDAVDAWSLAGARLLSTVDVESKPNLNVLTALMLKRQLLSARGHVNAASTTLASAIRLTRAMGLDKMCDQQSDVEDWAATKSSRIDNPAMVIQSDLFLAPIYFDHTTAADVDAVRSTMTWLSPSCAMVREAARRMYAHLAVQDWLSDPLSTIALSPSAPMPLPLPLEPYNVADEYNLRSATDAETPSTLHVARYLYSLARKIGAWKRDGRPAASTRELHKALLDDLRPTFLQPDAALPEDADLDAVQHMRTLVDLVQHYCLFIVQRSGGTAEACIEAAERVLQCRSTLGVNFPAVLHKFFDVQRYTLEAAVMVVIYLHQYGAQVTPLRRQVLEASIDEAYAQPGFEHAHSLLSLSFDAPVVASQQMPAPVNGVKRSASVLDGDAGVEDGSAGEEADKMIDGDNVDPGQYHATASAALSSGVGSAMGGQGMLLSNGARLASSHPIVVGLRAFVQEQVPPFGSAPQTTDFWDAVERHCQLFLYG